MLCSKCKKKNAVVYYKETVNGKTTEYALCADCAAEAEKAKKPSGYDMADDFFGMGSLFQTLLGGTHPQSAGKRCPLCGASFEQIAQSGKVGCAKCYETFAGELAPTVARIHGGAPAQAGRAPRRFGETRLKQQKEAERQKKLDTLKADMKAAVEAEEFEKAASLRDQIRALESGEGEN